MSFTLKIIYFYHDKYFILYHSIPKTNDLSLNTKFLVVKVFSLRCFPSAPLFALLLYRFTFLPVVSSASASNLSSIFYKKILFRKTKPEIIKINNFRLDLTDILATTKVLVPEWPCAITNLHYNEPFLDLSQPDLTVLIVAMDMLYYSHRLPFLPS